MNVFKRLTLVTGCVLALAVVAKAGALAACSWKLFPTIDPYVSGNQLGGVAGTGAADVWEVGTSFHKKSSRGYALHWNGRVWSSYPESDPHRHGGQLTSVAVLAPNDVWTVGSQYLTSGYAQSQAMIEHWNGTAFSEVAAPAVSGASTVLYHAAAFTPSDVWAAGGSQTTSGPEKSYLVHWDGSAWTLATSPNVPNESTNLVAIAGSSTSDVWAVGDYYGIPSSQYGTLAEHWDGTSWSIVPTPNVTGHSGRLNAVVTVAPADAWAVGEYVNGSKLAPLTEHWDGSKWSIVPSPDPGGGSVFLLGAAALSSKDVWAVGEIGTGPGTVSTFTLRWNGKVWRPGKSANVHGKPVTLLNAVASIPGSGLWAAGGDATAKIVVDTVTERYECPQEQSDSHR